jgi:Golgi phosphoprotein 3 (GPP34)
VVAVLLADEFVLLALSPTNDGWRLGPDGVPRTPWYLGPAVSMALLAELAVMGAVAVDDGRVVATGHPVSGDSELRATAAQLADHPKRRSTAWWGRRLAAARPDVRRLVALRGRGAILEYERVVRHLWWSRTVPSWFVREDDSATALILCRLRAALDTGNADERTTALLALLHACGLHRDYFKDLTHREREQRVQRLARRHWAWRATTNCLATISTPAVT